MMENLRGRQKTITEETEVGRSSHGIYRGKYSCKRVGKKSKPHLHPFFFLTRGIKDLYREYVCISLKCCVKNSRKQSMKLATCPIFSPRTQETPAVLRQLLSAVIQRSQAQRSPGFSWRLWFKPQSCCQKQQTERDLEGFWTLVSTCAYLLLPLSLPSLCTFPYEAHTSY